MAKKYVFNGLMILASLLALGGLVFPFYTCYISQLYGSHLLQGSISITGLAFAFGFDAIGTDSFINSVIRVIRQPIAMVILVLLVIGVVFSIVSIAIKRKNSVLFISTNLVFALLSLTTGFLTAFSNEIMNITLDGEIGLNKGGILIGGLVSEGIGFGAIITSACSFVLGVLALALTLISFFDYRNEIKNASPYPTFKGNVDLTTDPYLLEGEKEVKRLFFHKKERVIDSEEIDNNRNNLKAEGVNIIDETSKDNSSLLSETQDKEVNRTSEEIKDSSLNEPLLNDEKGNIKEEIETPKVEKKKKTLEEKLANLNKLRDENKISEAEYKKYKEAMIEEHFSSSSTFSK